MRGSLCVVALLLSTSLAGAALAEPTQVGGSPPPQRLGGGSDGIETRPQSVDEYCPVAAIFCVGPYRLERQTVDYGFTGGFVSWNNTTALAFYDGERYQRYGPYVVQMPVTDDIRVCYYQCIIPNPGYARLDGTFRVEVHVLGNKQVDRNATVHFVIGSDAGLPLPPPFGCDRWQTYCE